MKSRTAAIGRRLGATVRGPVLWLTVCGGLLVAAIFAGTIMMVGEFRERALANSERELENTVLLLTRHFDQQFEDSDTIAADVISRLHVSGIATPRDFRERIVEPRTPMKSCGPRPACCPISATSRFTIQTGRSINWSRPLPVPNLNISERAYFKTFKSDPQSPADPDRGGSQPHQQQSEHHHCPPAERRRRRLPRRDDAAHRPRQLREVLCFGGDRNGRRHLDVPRRRDPAGALSARRSN